MVALPTPFDFQRPSSSRWLQIIAPLAITAVATTALLVSVDFSDPISVLRACLAVALLFAVFARQANLIINLNRVANDRVRQLSVMGDVITTLSESPDVESTLRVALERIIPGLHADAAAVWLPSEHDPERLILVEQVGLPVPEIGSDLLEVVSETMRSWDGGVRRHRHWLAGQPKTHGPAHCMTVKLGRRAEDLGFLTVVRWASPFDTPDGGVLSTIGCDIAGTLRSLRLILQIQKLADCDPLTELYNHRYVHEYLAQAGERHAREGKPLSVLMLDLDNFKLFNDTYGHPAGDALLRRAANILRGFFRESDVVARYGGDEFIAILPETSLEQALACARRLQVRFSDEHYTPEGTLRVPIYISCGVASYPAHVGDPAQLVGIADENLYAAKARGTAGVSAGGAQAPEPPVEEKGGFELLRALVIAVDNKDRYTRAHSDQVTSLALQISDTLGLDAEARHTLHLCGLVHDLGKIGVPDRILSKPGPLTPDELAVMNQHPVIGALIVGALPGMEEVVQGVRHHHERYDGSGYPDGLAGTDIPRIARILAVADVYSAMTTHRPYRKALPSEAALGVIERGQGTLFDPDIARAFVDAHRRTESDAA